MKKRLTEIKRSVFKLFNPKKWTEAERKEFKALILLTILVGGVFFFLGRVYECNKQDGILASYKNDSFITKYIIPECKFNATIEETPPVDFEYISKVKSEQD